MRTNLKEHSPCLVDEWSEENYPLTPEKITYGSNKKVLWKGKCGHKWQASVKSRSSGENCPICSGKRVVEGINDLVTLKPELVKEWSDKNTLKPTIYCNVCGESIIPYFEVTSLLYWVTSF